MTCSGITKATVALNPSYLGKRQFSGVQVTASCDPQFSEESGCLITICSGAIVLRDSTVIGVPAPGLHTAVCVKQNSTLDVFKGLFSNSQVTPLSVYDRAHLTLHSSKVENNVVTKSGGGLNLEGYATAVITAGSVVQGNKAGVGGGGVHVQDNARVMVGGGSSISKNTADYGGGLQVRHNASVYVTGGSSIKQNVATESGGGCFVTDAARLVITNGSIAQGDGDGLFVKGDVGAVLTAGSAVQGNRAGRRGGWLYVTDDAHVVVDGGSKISNNAAPTGGGFSLQRYARVSVTGGGFSLQRNARVSVTGGGLSLQRNALVSVTGGGFSLQRNALFSVTGGSSIYGNRVQMFGGGPCLWVTQQV
jgi:hypothetical protein